MEDRDTGSPGYLEAERCATAEFEKAGLDSAGGKGYAEPVPLHDVRLQSGESPVESVRPDGVTELQCLRLGLP